MLANIRIAQAPDLAGTLLINSDKHNVLSFRPKHESNLVLENSTILTKNHLEFIFVPLHTRGLAFWRH